MTSNKTCVKLKNSHLNVNDEDFLYHLGFNTKSKVFLETFQDVMFVCMGGSPERMLYAAELLSSEMQQSTPLRNLCTTDRYVCYKVGPVLFINHGIGIGSLVVVLHEVIKALYYAKASQVSFIRIGTSGGLGINPGTVVLTDGAIDGLFNTHFEMPILGKLVKKPAAFDATLISKLTACKLATDDFDIITGKTLCAWDFYEGQGRLDGSYCDYNEEEKFQFLEKLKKFGVCNIEMESLCFGAITNQANIPAMVICVTLIDRLKGDLIFVSPETMSEWKKRPIELVIRMIKQHLQTTSN